MSDQTTPATPCGYIDDGYTLDFTIKEVPGVHVALNGKYRPMSSREVQNFVAALNPDKYKTVDKGKTVEDNIDAKQSAAIAAHIVEWDLVKPNGDSVEISGTSVSRIYPPLLMSKLINIVAGFKQPVTLGSRVGEIADRTDLDVEGKLAAIGDILNGEQPKTAGDDLKN